MSKKVIDDNERDFQTGFGIMVHMSINNEGRVLRIATVILTCIGLAIASYLTYVHYFRLEPICLSGGCEIVQSSPYAVLFGIPVALIGVVGYTLILLSLLIHGKRGRAIGFGLALVGFLYSAYLTYLELFVIQAICMWCVGSALVITLITILIAAQYKNSGQT